jgi:hypothetical protein
MKPRFTSRKVRFDFGVADKLLNGADDLFKQFTKSFGEVVDAMREPGCFSQQATE